jgi:hypothetical protein
VRIRVLLLLTDLCLAACGDGNRFKQIPMSRDVRHYDCRAEILASGLSSQYSELIDASDQQVHTVCPFDFRKTKIVTMFLKSSGGECNYQVVGKYPILRQSIVDDERQLGSCSDILNGPQTQGHGNDTYVWIPKSNPWQMPRSGDKFSTYTPIAILASGLPFTDNMPSNLGLCFTEKSGTNLPPSVLLGFIGVHQPDWAVERRFPDMSCEQAFGVLADEYHRR